MKHKTIEEQAREINKSLGFAMSEGSAVSRIEEALQKRDKIAREEEREKIKKVIARKREHRLVPILDPDTSSHRAQDTGYDQAIEDIEESLITPLTNKDSNNVL